MCPGIGRWVLRNTGPPGKPYLISSWMEPFFPPDSLSISRPLLNEYLWDTFVGTAVGQRMWWLWWRGESRPRCTVQALVRVVGFRLGIPESPSPRAVSAGHVVPGLLRYQGSAILLLFLPQLQYCQTDPFPHYFQGPPAGPQMRHPCGGHLSRADLCPWWIELWPFRPFPCTLDPVPDPALSSPKLWWVSFHFPGCVCARFGWRLSIERPILVPLFCSYVTRRAACCCSAPSLLALVTFFFLMRLNYKFYWQTYVMP